MADVLDSLVEEYQRRIIEEKQALQQAENARTTAMRNIDRIEGALLGVKDAIAKLSSSEGQAAECEMPQPDTEEQG